MALFVCGRKPTIGGSSDTEVNEPIVKPIGSSSCKPDTIVTPVGKCPSTLRKSFASKGGGSLVALASVSLIDVDTRLPRVTDPTPPDIVAAKRLLRQEMRRLRLEIASPERSVLICESLIGLVDPSTTALVMVYDAVPGEPDLTAFVAWCASVGVETIAPDPTPTAAVPGRTVCRGRGDRPRVWRSRADGHRLGQGGGWYDRLLAEVRTDGLTIGVCFEPQLVDGVPDGAARRRPRASWSPTGAPTDVVRR